MPEGKIRHVSVGGPRIWQALTARSRAVTVSGGFRGYYLNDAKGAQLAKGPIEIVLHKSRAKRDPSVINGISCMGCHNQGMIQAKDEIRPHVLQDGSFSNEVRRQVEALYPAPERMKAVLDQDGSRFRNAMLAAGLDPGLQLHNIEMINALAHRFEMALNLRAAAAEFGLAPDELRRAARPRGGRVAAVVQRLEQSSVPRDQFEGQFAAFVPAVTEDEPLAFKGLPGAPAAAKVREAPPALAQTFDLALTSDRRQYKQGDRAVFTVVSRQDCNLTLLNVDEKDTATILFPNQFQQENAIRAGREFRFGDDSTPFRFRLSDRGTETVIAVCNASRKASAGLESDFKAGGFTDLGNYNERLTRGVGAARQARTRQIQIEAAPGPASGRLPEVGRRKPDAPGQAAGASGAQAGLDIVARTAIKIEVQ